MKQGKKFRWKNFIRENYTGWLFNLPLGIGILVFTLIPVVCSLFYSFMWKYDGMTFSAWSFQNYTTIFTADWDEVSRSFLNTVIYSVVSIPLGLVTSYFLALLVNARLKGVKVFRILYYLPVTIPAVVSGLLWKDMFGQTYGIFNRILGIFGIPPYPFFADADTSMISVFIMNLWTVGSGMILWLSAFKNIDRQYYEAVQIEGGGRFAGFLYITIPMSTPMIFYNVIMSTINTLQYNGPLTFAPNGGRGWDDSLFMFAVKIYQDAIEGGKIGYGSALSWVFLVVIALITLLLFKTSKWVFYGEEA